MKGLLLFPLKACRHIIKKQHAQCVHQLLDGEFIGVLDVGAAGGILPNWSPYRANVKFIGFEPDQRSYELLMVSQEAKEFKDYKIFPHALWSTNGSLRINLTRKSINSSPFTFNKEFISRFPDSERMDIVREFDVQCQTLDDLLDNECADIDFIKADLEGGELAVLQGGKRMLSTCLGLQLEVSFHQVRQGQPLFGDVCQFLAEYGLEFFDFVALNSWTRSPMRGIGQLIFGDALFLRSPEAAMEMAHEGIICPKKLKNYMAILVIYKHFDLARKILQGMRESGWFVDSGYIERVEKDMSEEATATQL